MYFGGVAPFADFVQHLLREAFNTYIQSPEIGFTHPGNHLFREVGDSGETHKIKITEVLLNHLLTEFDDAEFVDHEIVVS